MRVLFFCNTYYQLITAIQMRLTLKKNDSVSVVLTDASKGSEKVYISLKCSGVFEGVYHLAVNEHKSSLQCFKEGIGGIHIDGMENMTYDELIGFNYDIPTCALYASLEKANKAIRCNIMEEGLLSYNTPDSDCNIAKLIHICRKILGRKNAREKRELFYCFNKKAYRGRFEAIEIPPITQEDGELRRILFDVFLGGETPAVYDQKYIYLASVYDFEGGEPVGELEVAKSIADAVGHDNFIVKVHPRDDAERYKEAGLTVAENSSVPWEVFQIGCDFSKKVLLSSFSASLINLSSIIANCGKSVYTNHMCNIENNPLAQHYGAIIDGYLSKSEDFGLINISSASSANEMP